MQPRVASMRRSKISSSPRTSSCAVGSSRMTTPAPRLRRRTAPGRARRAATARPRGRGRRRTPRDSTVSRSARSAAPASRARRDTASSDGAPAGRDVARAATARSARSPGTPRRCAPATTRGRCRAGRRRRPRSRPPVGSYMRHSSLASVVLPAPFWPTIASERPAGIVRSRPSSTSRSRRRVGEAHVARSGSPLRHPRPACVPSASSAPAGAIASVEVEHERDRLRAPSSHQSQSANAIALAPIAACANDDERAERDAPSPRRAPATRRRRRSRRRRGRCARRRGRAPQPALGPRQVEQVPAQRREPADDPVGEPEQAHLLRGRRLDGEPVRVAGSPLLSRRPRRWCGPARSRSRAASSACCPSAAPSSSGAHQRYPNSTSNCATPPPNCAKPLPMCGIETTMLGPVRPRSKSRAAERSSASVLARGGRGPAGRRHASSRRSWNNDEPTAPRFVLKRVVDRAEALHGDEQHARPWSARGA